MNPSVTRIDIATELAAIKQGECGCCRIYATHGISPDCNDTPAFEDMAVCGSGHVYYPGWFDSCPVCEEFKGRIKP